MRANQSGHQCGQLTVIFHEFSDKMTYLACSRCVQLFAPADEGIPFLFVQSKDKLAILLVPSFVLFRHRPTPTVSTHKSAHVYAMHMPNAHKARICIIHFLAETSEKSDDSNARDLRESAP